MIPDLFLHGLLDDRRQVPFTYWLATVQLALLLISRILGRASGSDLWLLFFFLANVCLLYQVLFLWRIVAHKLGDRIDKRFPPVGHAAMFSDLSPVSEFGWLHATGGGIASIVGSVIVYLLS